MSTSVSQPTPPSVSRPMAIGTGYKNVIKELMPLCPVCERTCRGHKYIELGACSQMAFYELVIHLFRKHDWPALGKVGSFDPTRDALVAFAVRGDHPLATVALVSTPPDSCARSWIMLQEVISNSEVEAMRGSGYRDWQPV
jgi:hypothetical protein